MRITNEKIAVLHLLYSMHIFHDMYIFKISRKETLSQNVRENYILGYYLLAIINLCSRYFTYIN